MLAAALRTRRRPTPQRLLKQQNTRHLSFGAAQELHPRTHPPEQQQEQQRRRPKSQTADLEAAKPTSGTLLRRLGDNVFTHKTWTTEILAKHLAQEPRLWREFAQKTNPHIEPPPPQRGWPTPVLSPADAETYLPHLYARGWFIEHDTPQVGDGIRGVPSLAKHFFRLSPTGGSNYEFARSINFRAVVQSLEKQENVRWVLLVSISRFCVHVVFLFLFFSIMFF